MKHYNWLEDFWEQLHFFLQEENSNPVPSSDPVIQAQQEPSHFAFLDKALQSLSDQNLAIDCHKESLNENGILHLVPNHKVRRLMQGE